MTNKRLTVTVSGEAGSGRSTLLAAIAKLLEDQGVEVDYGNVFELTDKEINLLKEDSTSQLKLIESAKLVDVQTQR